MRKIFIKKWGIPLLFVHAILGAEKLLNCLKINKNFAIVLIFILSFFILNSF